MHSSRRAELGQFLKARRARVSPDEVGVEPFDGALRRVPGLLGTVPDMVVVLGAAGEVAGVAEPGDAYPPSPCWLRAFRDDTEGCGGLNPAKHRHRDLDQTLWTKLTTLRKARRRHDAVHPLRRTAQVRSRGWLGCDAHSAAAGDERPRRQQPRTYLSARARVVAVIAASYSSRAAVLLNTLTVEAVAATASVA
jgi:hypothetical protein